MIIFVTVYTFREQIVEKFIDTFIPKGEVSFDYKNSYYLDYNYSYLSQVEDFNITNKKDLVNLYYTVVNDGYLTFDFYCPEEYVNCINDVEFLANNREELSLINGFVHPYNSFEKIKTVYDSLGRVKLTINRLYSNDDIQKINSKIEDIIKNEIKDEKDKRTIIKIVHDYIINNTIYDKDRTDKKIINYRSDTAYGVLFEGYGVCSGYSDTMALFLNYYDIPNYKITSENHVWNAVYLDGKWYHLDLTWDDPIMNTGENVLDDSYFLISTEELKKLKDDQHYFNVDIYKEFANN